MCAPAKTGQWAWRLHDNYTEQSEGNADPSQMPRRDYTIPYSITQRTPAYFSVELHKPKDKREENACELMMVMKGQYRAPTLQI